MDTGIQMSGVSLATGLKIGQFNQKSNFALGYFHTRRENLRAV